MSKKRSLSAEEKRTKLLEIFYESGDIFQLKELEKLAPRDKGIVQQSVKTVVQELVDDGKVRTEKISGSIFYWAFPSDSLNNAFRLMQETEAANVQLNSKLYDGREKFQASTEAALNCDENNALQQEIELLDKEKKELEQKLALNAIELDYGDIKAKLMNSKRILEATNRWTDNIFSIKTWCKQKFAKEDRELNQAFGIPEELDYLEA